MTQQQESGLSIPNGRRPLGSTVCVCVTAIVSLFCIGSMREQSLTRQPKSLMGCVCVCCSQDTDSCLQPRTQNSCRLHPQELPPLSQPPTNTERHAWGASKSPPPFNNTLCQLQEAAEPRQDSHVHQGLRLLFWGKMLDVSHNSPGKNPPELTIWAKASPASGPGAHQSGPKGGSASASASLPTCCSGVC